MSAIFKTNARRGSALLIVLGFLSFMMISAVSFAVYMRVERQASSNYRHAVTARHLLNAGLFRAIDEIDSELRIDKVNTEAKPRPLKFPAWPGRTKPSAVCNGIDNGQEARVLSLEALSFIPGILVNDVRRYAVTNKLDKAKGTNLALGKHSYFGTKWRALSMPVASVASGENAFEEAVIGRYAYLCVNVSDMLNVNVCKAAVRDAGTNRVSIGHLFGANSDAVRKAFDNKLKNTDFRYETLQDFYACMFARDDPTFGSPFHEYLDSGRDDAPPPAISFNNASSHILVTDGVAGAQPTRSKACNIVEQQPFPPSVLTAARAAPASLVLQNQSVDGRDGFKTALSRALTGGRLAGGNLDHTFPTCLADYIDEDGVPEQLNMPSVELVPMISQILVPDFFAPTITMTTMPGTAPNPTKDVYFLNMFAPGAPPQMEVEVVWPFKNVGSRTQKPTFKVELQVYFKVLPQHRPLKSSDFVEPPITTLPAHHYYPAGQPLTGEGTIPDFWAKDTSDPAACYDKATVSFTANPAQYKLEVFNTDAGANTVAGFAGGKPFSVALVVFARIKQGTEYVDSAPQLLPYPGLADPVSEYMATQQKIFFQTVASAPVPAAPTGPVPYTPNQPIPYEWKSLEVPDPRFNYKASNWVKNPEQNTIAPKINQSTLDLLGKEGRDGDIYLSVSDVGRLQSPGELGFIVRPFGYDPVGKSVDFRSQNSANDSEDKDAMFRTIRLYDHGDPGDEAKRAHDLIYANFTAQNADGTVAGARVNPLSDIPQVLAAAVEGVPTDYWVAARDASEEDVMIANSFNKRLTASDWAKFTNGWVQCLLNARKPDVSEMNTSWKTGLPDIYGDLNKFGWYSDDGQEKIFDTRGGFSVAGVPATLNKPLHEIDRKMLFSYTLESFSDRQQLFLYILRAEATVPSFGGTQEGGMRSLAGGRAVALVWRDPYPEGYDKENDTWLNKGNNKWYQQQQTRTIKRMSPWYQVNIDDYDDAREEYDADPSLSKRYDGFHRHRILYFKQLEQ